MPRTGRRKSCFLNHESERIHVMKVSATRDQIVAAKAYEDLHVPALFRQWAPRLVAAAQRARDVAAAVAGKLRTYAVVLGAAGAIAWITWVDPWQARSLWRILFVLGALGVLVLPALAVGRFALGLAALADLPERIRSAPAGDASRAMSGALTAGRAAVEGRAMARVRAAFTAVSELRKALAAARTTAAAVAVPAATVGFGGVAGAMAGLLFGAPLIALAVAGLFFAL